MKCFHMTDLELVLSLGLVQGWTVLPIKLKCLFAILCSSYTLSLFYYQELGMLSNQVVTSEEIPSPYVSLPRLTALVRYIKICLGTVFFEPSLKSLTDGLDNSCSMF